jgi:hypothetical protein
MVKTLVQVSDDLILDLDSIVALFDYGDGWTKIYLTDGVSFKVRATLPAIMGKIREVVENG